MLGRTARATSLGCLVGCAGGVVTAASDFGAHWLWLDGWNDRVDLFLKLFGLQVPIGTLLGGLLGLVLGLSEPPLRGLARWLAGRGMAEDKAIDGLRALRLAALLAPALFVLGWLLFSGGSMSRLPGRAALIAVTRGGLLAFALGGVYAGHRLDRRFAERPPALRRIALLALGLGLLLSKLNQWVLPKLYDYLHGSLTAASFALFALAAYWVVRSLPSPPRGAVLRAGLFVPLSAGAFAALTATLDNLEHNQNVRVALLHPNAPHSRGVMQALAPYVIEPAQRRAMAEARRRARRARGRRAQTAEAVAGPVLEDAHVLLITIDALRADHLGSYGYQRPTSPNIDRLAEQSVLFEHAYAPAPHSSYSLCSLMTSEFLHETLDLGQPPPAVTLPTLLARAGYHTAAFYTQGIFHTAGERLSLYEKHAFGFALHDQATYTAEELTERALAEIDRSAARGEPNSFFWVHYFDVHEPYRSTHFGTADMDRYDSEILHVDREIERLVSGARKRLARKLIVVLTSDHGEEFHEHGGVYHGSTLYEEQVRVPLLVSVPGMVPRRVPAPVSTIDLAPTLLHLLGLPAADSMRGRDLRPLALGLPPPFTQVFAAVIHKRMVVQWPYKLIADLRFGLFELYDLERDPRERANLADERPDLVSNLRLEVYGWLDSLTTRAAADEDPIAAALAWGRLGDRRAVEPLSRVVQDEKAAPEQRIDAARMLGHLSDAAAANSLVAALRDERNAKVAAEAAIALGRMFDARARNALRQLVHAEDADTRVRAAVSLGRLRDPEAVPALIEALWIAPGDYERQEAVRWLGRLRDPRALEPLIELLPERRTRFLVVTAIGMIGDRRAYDRLAQLLAFDTHANVRDATVQGLGLLGDPRAIEPIARLAAEETSLSFATESLVRLGALQAGAIGGTDLVQGDPGLRDFHACHVGPLLHDWDYQHRTYCVTRQKSATLALRVPKAVAEAEHGVMVALSIKRTDASAAALLRLRIGGHALAPVPVDGSFGEERWTLPPGALREGRVRAELSSDDPAARFAVDHLLLLPRRSVVIAQAAEE